MPPSSKKKATIYDLSQLSGSSASTVSAVLNGSWRKRRIKEATAQLIQSLADEHGYSTNLQARGLRQSRSGLVGLMLPLYDNRFFSALAQGFEARVRARGLCPLVVSGCRDPQLELSTVESLLAYSIDELFIVGATDPDSIHGACARAGVRHLNLDLPGTLAPSITSDNYAGAFELTQAILSELAPISDLSSTDLCLFGGYSDYASRERIGGFLAAKRAHFGEATSDDVFSAPGYSPAMTRQALTAHVQCHGRLPRGVFINSTINLEGLLGVLPQQSTDPVADLVVGCFDYDPFASFLPFPVYMMRQNVERILELAFELIDQPEPEVRLYKVAPILVPPRTALPSLLDASAQDY
ncbi:MULTISPECIES: LacI family DNA-binding transcriptional regulator [Pseudomonas syringae group]|nr:MULTISPECIES: LacI family DNA-binding transcriptional regulator [Pseudomonas syringae group]KTC61271.1 LacI family transcriptional regulator [Pseudomonas savastanoi]MDU8543611.1 LacI family DNA-binding transcriptional regulator [Pseudomonas syringae group sp. J248-6]UFI45770.1 LacI family DNA-binding transcriptional regulator [Pseudomonas savastanoi]